MLSVVLKILSISGILLLCLLGLAVLLILLVLFFPVNYKLTGKRNTEQMTVSARVSWLFGLLRASLDYPEPGRILVKILPFTVYDSGKEARGKKKKDKASGGRPEEEAGKNGGKAERGKQSAGAEGKPEKCVNQTLSADPGQEAGAGPGQAQAAEQENASDSHDNSRMEAADEKGDSLRKDNVSSEGAAVTDPSSDGSNAGEAGDSTDFFIFKKFKKIKYTIRSIYDKIKNIWENISCYIELLQEEETKQLFSHVIFRLGKILKNVRPRHIRGQILFGTGSPDTTGYAYGVYGMLSPFLGNKVLVTPDFSRAVLEGDIYVSGHITVFTILWNVLRVLVDKKLRRFINKMKAGRKK